MLTEISQSHETSITCFLSFVDARRKQNKTTKVMKVQREQLGKRKGKGKR
jgi:hypothetical protein